MLHWLEEIRHGSGPVEFVSAFGLEESVERLRAATRRSVFSALAKQEAVGTVTPTQVSLQRVIPMVGNSFKPFFRGRFVEKAGRVILVGHFTMHWLLKAFMLFWFAVVLLFTLGSAASFVAQPSKANATPLFGLGMLAFAVALVSLGRWFARNDPAWLSDVIRRALAAPAAHAHSAGDAIGTVAPLRPSAVPTYTAVLLTATGLLGCCMAISGVQLFQSGPQGAAITHFYGRFMQYSVLGWGLISLALAYGIYRRRLLAWRGFLVMIGTSWIYAMAETLAVPQPWRAAETIFMGLGGFVVSFIWGRWWYAQREHFQE